MYSRILVAIDGSPTSEHALRQAIGLAKGLSSTLRIVHIVDMGVLPAGAELAVDMERVMEARRDAGEKVLKSAQDLCRAAGVATETRLVETGTPAQRVANLIAEEAKSWPADLVITGTHGRTGVARMLVGSVAEGIARVSPAPVLLVPMP